MYITTKRTLISSFLFGAWLFSSPTFAVDASWHGEVVEASCILAPESANQDVNFLERSVKDFNFEPGYSPREKFTIKLIECDNSAFNTVKIRFYGQRENNMTEKSDYFLAVRGVNSGRLGIGIIDVDGTPLKLGETPSLGESHNSGTGTIIGTNKILNLNFSAYVQATPDAMMNKTVVPGSYSSSATFEIFYE
ncbi:fimbrial protein [Photobacterium phosphoreum]|uniref:fimbrial protein n=1 Tax=Photobacterium phosphoreum TaxID=659 RepID=UPI0024B7B4B2|nr:fimbrial protein [Photobacterium phosphoreum]